MSGAALTDAEAIDGAALALAQQQIGEMAVRVEGAIRDIAASVRRAGFPPGSMTIVISRALVESAKIDGVPERDALVGVMSVWDEVTPKEPKAK